MRGQSTVQDIHHHKIMGEESQKEGSGLGQIMNRKEALNSRILNCLGQLNS